MKIKKFKAVKGCCKPEYDIKKVFTFTWKKCECPEFNCPEFMKCSYSRCFVRFEWVYQVQRFSVNPYNSQFERIYFSTKHFESEDDLIIFLKNEKKYDKFRKSNNL